MMVDKRIIRIGEGIKILIKDLVVAILDQFPILDMPANVRRSQIDRHAQMNGHKDQTSQQKGYFEELITQGNEHVRVFV